MAAVVDTANPIHVRGLRKRYGNASVVQDVDLEVHPGEVFALLGPNGAGKTTTVEILEGVRRRTGGDVSVLGRDPAEDAPEWRARLGIVPQTTGAYSDLTVREVIEHFAAFYPAPLPVEQAMEMVGLRKQERKQAHQLSGGQLRRLDVAVGIVGDPDLIFLDEPTTGLDPAARLEAWELVRYFADRGKTTLLTTHYLDEVEALAQRAAVIVAGKVVEVGTVAELGGRRDTPAVVSFTRVGRMAGLTLPLLPPDALVDPSDDEVVTLHTHSPTQALAAILPWAAEAGVHELPDLRVQRPTLEDVYLKLISENQGADS
ncbi:ABC transporter ATP-binding protein [Sphaerisporangium corydalis]|uniref:ABC transporter ATP-binding protein n=1 Tax=Sphaerisporangium corydalis TaxID=1441875 RepID=A0ABV9EJG5_9ACTN|nr:ABC transporter ATP-binding protein [Sphaerisporangium corydalis]